MKNNILPMLAPTGFLALVLAWGAFSAPFPAVQHNILDNASEINGRLGAKTRVVLRGTAAYTVPQGRGLVITAMGVASSSGTQLNVELLVDGIVEVTVLTSQSLMELSYPGCLVKSGEVATLAVSAGTPDYARAWGYLVEH